MRSGRVIRQPGCDGEYGVIRLFEEGEVARLAGQGSLFGDGPPVRSALKRDTGGLPLAPLAEGVRGEGAPPGKAAPPAKGNGPNPEQAELF